MAYKLASSPLTALWRDADIGNLWPPLVKAGLLKDSDAKRLVACAKKRFDTARGAAGAIDYSTLEITASIALKGLCFVAADEFERYFAAQQIDAKCVRVVDDRGGGDHYFTVVNENGSALIVDATWRQFHTDGNLLRYCLVGDLKILTGALSVATVGNLLEMYAAGAKVIKSWKTYRCFGA